jgi:hypothetical protein
MSGHFARGAVAGAIDFLVAPGLTRGPACSDYPMMNGTMRGGWVYIMADRYRGAMYVV